MILDEFKKRSVGYITTAFGLVAGLAWNEAIKSFINYFFPMRQNGMVAEFVYAIVITFILVFVTVYILRADGEESNDKKSEKEKKSRKKRS